MSDEIRERIKLARSYCDEGMGSDVSRMVISDLADDLDSLLDRPVSQNAQCKQCEHAFCSVCAVTCCECATVNNFLQSHADAAQAEIARLKRGDFTPGEFQNLCHNLSETDRDVFVAGCAEYQRKLFGGKP